MQIDTANTHFCILLCIAESALIRNRSIFPMSGYLAEALYAVS